MEYKDRNYRSRFAGDNRRWFSVKFLESDLWIGVDSGSDIGLDEYIGYETGITVIEWPEFIKDLIPETAIEVNITHVQDNVRNIKITSDDKELMEGLK